MTRIVIELVDDPVPEKRARAKVQRMKDGSFTPQIYRDPKSVIYAAKFRVAAQLAWKEQTGGAPPTCLPCRIEVDVFVRCAQSPSISPRQAAAYGLSVSSGKQVRALMLAGTIRPKGSLRGSVRYGDVDNHLKTILDACTRNVWEDDSGVVDAVVRKWYAETGRTVAIIETIGPPALALPDPALRKSRAADQGTELLL